MNLDKLLARNLDGTDMFYDFKSRNILEFFRCFNPYITRVYAEKDIEKTIIKHFKKTYKNVPNLDIEQYFRYLHSEHRILTIKINGRWYLTFVDPNDL